jgi:hypothetical protein
MPVETTCQWTKNQNFMTRWFTLSVRDRQEGIISGTLHNSATKSTQTIEGMADKETQRAAWTVVGKTRPIMETGIVNLTEDSAPALVHFADDSTQQWLLARLEEPAPEPKKLQ